MTASSEDAALMALVARKYYLGGQSKSEIGEQLYLSRFKVARLLEEAAELGIVRFSIELRGDVNQSLASQLRTAFRLKHAVVVDDDADSAVLLHRLGAAIVELLGEVVSPGKYIGISSTRTLMGLPRITTRLSPATFVQLNGSLSRPDAMDIIDGIRKLTARARGTAHVFYAPLVAASESAWNGYRTQPDARLAFSKFARLSVAVTGLGSWRKGLSVTYDNLPATVRNDAARRGAVAEVLGLPIDAQGRTVGSEARERIVAPDAEVLKRIPTTIGVAMDERKAEAVRIAIRHDLVNSLVTHRALAERLLDIDLGTAAAEPATTESGRGGTGG